MPDLAGSWLDDKRMMDDSDYTFNNRLEDIRHFVRWLNDAGESFEPVERDRHKTLLHQYFLSINEEGYARNTISNRWNTLNAFYDDLAGFYGEFEESPFEDLYERRNYLPKKTREETKREKPYVTREQKELLCENVRSPAFRNECMLRLMWQTGLREGEVAELRLEDVNLQENKLDEFWSPKISTERTVTFKESLNWWLDEWINGGYRNSYPTASRSDHLFVTNRSTRFDRNRPNEVIKSAAEDAGIQEVLYVDKAGKDRHKITSHAVRRGHAMHLLKNGKNLRTIQKRLSHAKIETTVEYLPLSPEDVGEQIEDISF